MSDDFPELRPSKDGESVVQRAKNLIPWLPDPHICDDCKVYCDAEEDFVPNQAIIMPVWTCPECGKQYHRQEEWHD